MSFLEIENLQVDLKEFKLKGVSFSLEEGEYLTIIGPTGAGKTILLESIIGFHELIKGKIIIDGRDVTEERPEKRRMGIVYQDYALLPHFTIRSNIEYGLKKKFGAKDPSIPERVEHLASSLNINHLLERKPGTLSGGEQQRAAIARALAVEPRVLLMDEPFSALDPQTRRRTRHLLKKMISESGITVIHITHDMEDVWTFADKVSVLREGEQLQFGTAEEIFQRPACRYTADFVGTSLYSGTVIESRDFSTTVDIKGLLLNSMDAAFPLKSRVDVAIRPENVSLYKDNPGESGVHNIIPSILVDIMEEGSTCTALISFRDLLLEAKIDKTSALELNERIGKDVYAAVKKEDVKLIPA